MFLKTIYSEAVNPVSYFGIMLVCFYRLVTVVCFTVAENIIMNSEDEQQRQ